MKVLFFMIVACLVVIGSSQAQYIPKDLPIVPDYLISRVNFLLNVLTTQVQTFNWKFCDKMKLSKQVIQTKQALESIKDCFPGINNVNYGSGNEINGKYNFVFGDRDTVTGNNNWLFISDYASKGVEDGVLAIKNYKIQFSKIDLIKKDPTKCISLVDSSEIEKLKSQFPAISYYLH